MSEVQRNNPLRILIVDDDRLNNALVQFAFKEGRFDVETALNGAEALEVLAARRPDLIVLDVQMPRMSGFEFLAELRASPELRGIPVIMLTANQHMQDLFLGEGAREYLTKPVDPAQLLLRARALLGMDG